jgi:hypothetical protein
MLELERLGLVDSHVQKQALKKDTQEAADRNVNNEKQAIM